MARFWGGKRRDFRIRTIKRKKGLTKSSGYSIIGFAGSSRLERWPSGLWRWSWKPVIPQGAGGSNPSLSAIFYGEFHSVSVMQKYPRGRRGSPAKGVGCGKRREGSNPSFCAIVSTSFWYKGWCFSFTPRRLKSSYGKGFFRYFLEKVSRGHHHSNHANRRGRQNRFQCLFFLPHFSQNGVFFEFCQIMCVRLLAPLDLLGFFLHEREHVSRMESICR